MPGLFWARHFAFHRQDYCEIVLGFYDPNLGVTPLTDQPDTTRRIAWRAGTCLHPVKAFSRPTDQIDLCAVFFSCAFENVTGFDAKMWDIDQSGWIGGIYFQFIANCERLQPFAGFQDRQRAEQPLGI